jgi:thiol-disulfide isomerase/thioredoxin
MKQDEFLKSIESNKYSVIEIYANYCPHCKFMKPIIDKLVLNYPEIQFTSINTDDTDSNWINEEYKINTIPRYLFFKGTKLQYEHEGAGPIHVFEFHIKTKLFEQNLLNIFDKRISKEEFAEILSSNNNVVALIISDNNESKHILPYYAFIMNQFNEVNFITINSTNSENIISFDIELSIDEIHYPYFMLFKEKSLVHSFSEVNQDVVRYLIADGLFDHPIKSYDGINDQEFQKILEDNPLTILYVFKEEGDSTLSMKTQLYNFHSKFKDIHIGSIKYSEAKWLADKHQITAEEYKGIIQFVEPVKKLPYFLFYKHHELIYETGPVDVPRFDNLIQDKLRDNRFW